MDDNACKHQKMLPYLLVLQALLISVSAQGGVLNPGVRLIDPANVTLYSCDTGDIYDSSTWLLVYPNGMGQVEVNNTISSRQAGGLMHKVFAVQEVGIYLFMLASVAELEDIFEYMNESQETQTIERVTRLVAEEFIPDPNLVESLIKYTFSNDNFTLNGSAVNVSDATGLNGTLPGSGAHDFVPAGENVLVFTDQDVWKCAGHRYRDNYGNEHVTYYLVMPSDQNQNVTAGDILVGSKSGGFLEIVASINETGGKYFVHSDLLLCGELEENVTNLIVIDIDMPESTMFCQGGDGIPGLHVNNQSAAVNFGDVIAGRPSGAFAAKAIRCNTSGAYTYCEMTPILDIANNEVILASSNLPTEKGNRVTRKTYTFTPDDFTKVFSATLGQIKFPCGKFTATAAATFKASLTTSLTTKSSSPFIQNVRAALSTSLTLSLTFRLDIECSYTKTGPDNPKYKHPIDNVVIVPFCIPIFRGICIPAAVVADLTVAYTLTAQMKGFVSLTLKRTGSLEASAEWDHSKGISYSGPSVSLTPMTKNFDGGLEKDETFVRAEVAITPALKVRIPNMAKINRIIREASKLIRWWLKDLFGEAKAIHLDPILEFVLSAPLIGRAEAVACPSDCENYPEENVKVAAHAGLPESYDGDLYIREPLTQIAIPRELFSKQGNQLDWSKCLVWDPFPPCEDTTTTSTTAITPTPTETATPYSLPTPPDVPPSVVSGDPHMITFDGARITYDGACRYLLTGLCPIYKSDAEYFTLSGRNTKKGRGIFMEDVLLTLYGHRVHLSHEGIVSVDGKEQNLPFWNGRINITKTVLANTHARVSKRLMLEPVLRLESVALINITLTVRHPDSDGQHHLRMEIPGQYRGKLCGLAQNFNGDPSDDYRLCDGQDIRHIAPAQIRDQIIAESCRVWDKVDGPSPIC